jgi:hypothetical protein
MVRPLAARVSASVASIEDGFLHRGRLYPCEASAKLCVGSAMISTSETQWAAAHNGALLRGRRKSFGGDHRISVLARRDCHKCVRMRWKRDRGVTQWGAHRSRNGKLYRYYIDMDVLKRGAAPGPVTRSGISSLGSETGARHWIESANAEAARPRRRRSHCRSQGRQRSSRARRGRREPRCYR